MWSHTSKTRFGSRTFAAAAASAALLLLAPAARAQTAATGAGEAALPQPTTIAGIELSELDFGFGVTLDDAGGAAGQFSASLYGDNGSLSLEVEVDASWVDEMGLVALGGNAELLVGDILLATVPVVIGIGDAGFDLAVSGEPPVYAELVAGSIETAP